MNTDTSYLISCQEDRVIKLRDGMIRRDYINEEKISAVDLDW